MSITFSCYILGHHCILDSPEFHLCELLQLQNLRLKRGTFKSDPNHARQSQLSSFTSTLIFEA